MKLYVNFKYLLIALIVFIIVGCSAMEKNPQTIEFLLQQTTMRYIEKGKTPEGMADRKAQVLSVADKIETAFVNTEKFTVTSLRELITSNIKVGSLQPSDQALMGYLFNLGTAELNLPTEAPIQLTEVQRSLFKKTLSTIRAAAGFY